MSHVLFVVLAKKYRVKNSSVFSRSSQMRLIEVIFKQYKRL